MTPTIKVGQTIKYKAGRSSSSGRVARVGESTVDIAGPRPSQGLGTYGPIQLGGRGVMTIAKSDIETIEEEVRQ